jgi:TPR repeat protein
VENDAATLFARASALAVKADDDAALKQAFSLFSRAAQQGDGRSLEALAVMLENGQGVVMALERAADLFALAWQDGSPSAAYRLGCMIRDGRVRTEFEPEDRDEAAAELFSDAAAVGSLEAMVALAAFKASGRGGPKDTSAAHTLLERAAFNGHPNAGIKLAHLCQSAGKMSAAWAWFALVERAKNVSQESAQKGRMQVAACMDSHGLMDAYEKLLQLEANLRP